MCSRSAGCGNRPCIAHRASGREIVSTAGPSICRHCILPARIAWRLAPPDARVFDDDRGDDPARELLALRAAHSAGLLKPPAGTRLVVAGSEEAKRVDLESDATSLVYCFGSAVRFESDLSIARSDQAVAGWLKRANPGNWEPVEWDELLDGSRGPRRAKRYGIQCIR